MLFIISKFVYKNGAFSLCCFNTFKWIQSLWHSDKQTLVHGYFESLDCPQFCHKEINSPQAAKPVNIPNEYLMRWSQKFTNEKTI